MVEEYPHEEIELPDKALSLIADDSDWHRTRRGYMCYENANLFECFGDRKWAIARGESCGRYPARPYDSDLIGLDLSKENSYEKHLKRKGDKETLKKLEDNISLRVKRGIETGRFFQNSLIYGMSDGQLVAGSFFRDELLKLLKPEIGNFIDQNAEYDENIITLSLRPLNTKRMKYKPEFVNFLSESIVKLLENAK